MNSLRSLTWNILLLLCLVCLLAFSGCQRQGGTAVTGEPSKLTETSDPVLSEDILSESEPPVISSEIPSSQETPVSSEAEPISSQPSPEPPASQNASSSSQTSSQVSRPAIPFTVGAVDKDVGIPIGANSSDFNNTFGAIVIRSAAEYREQFAPDNASVSSGADTDSAYHSDFSKYLSKYNDAFFEENALIYMVTHHARSCSLNDYIHSLVRSGNQLTIRYTVAVTDPPPSGPYPMADVGGGRKTLIEVKKSDVEGVTEFIPQQSGSDAPPTWWF